MLADPPSLPLEQALASLADHAQGADAELAWPDASWDAVRRAGVLRWIVPVEYGGQGLPPAELLAGYEQVAAACLTTCFLLSQRDAACRRLRDSGHAALCRELLPPLARGDCFATVGLAQLTTSHQHVAPVLRARLMDGCVELDGVMPWVTGASKADYLITGVVLEDRRQLLLVVPGTTPGVRVAPAVEVMALQGAMTAQVHCEQVRLDRRWVLAGPSEKPLAAGKGPGGLETSALALGLVRSAVSLLEQEAGRRPEWRDRAEACRKGYQALMGQMASLARGEGDAAAASRLRARANALVLRVTQLALAASKGAGFQLSHPAQRWARQALFFLVWSCPSPTLEATLDCMELPDLGDGEKNF
jgi:alkylation response protein AidB-like acyl-CoA dehydrogenase